MIDRSCRVQYIEVWVVRRIQTLRLDESDDTMRLRLMVVGRGGEWLA